MCQHVTELDLVCEGHNQVKTAWMEGNSMTLLLESGRNFVGLRGVVPNRHGLILGTGDDELLPHTGVKASDLVLVEWTDDMLKRVVDCLSLFRPPDVNLPLDELSIRSGDKDLVFLLVCANGQNLGLFLPRVKAQLLGAASLAHTVRVLDLNVDAFAVLDQQGTFISLVIFEDVKATFHTDDETLGERIGTVDSVRSGTLQHEGLVGSSVCAEEHLTFVSADEDHAGLLGPSVTGEVG